MRALARAPQGVARVESWNPSTRRRARRAWTSRPTRRRAASTRDDDDGREVEDEFDRFARAVERAGGTTTTHALGTLARALGTSSDGVLASAFVGCATSHGRYAARAEIRSIDKTIERYDGRVRETLARARASLEGGGASARARACGERVREAEKATSALVRATLGENALEERDLLSSGAIGGGGVPRAATGAIAEAVPEKWRMACANAGAFVELRGATLSVEEWAAIRTVFEAIVRVMDGDEASANLVGDAKVWTAMKSLIDDSTTRPRRLSQVENNARYQSALSELDEAKKAWKEADKAYKLARQRVKRARHDVHRTRKAVRIEYR
ncbi:unnamed product [Ostreococcus tauri]|uniref:Unnamed product n=1 Tax=Ostreococcus tauri TaxID=70448 RepID=A0A096P7L2_OSTTA|nr:unnamed product [Ostreococcus tauri]CEG00175.1 unnamed product [Ostreococcus tauri]|eukprot:XP_022840234.1 unnamed product [Ostreococcus tauri]